MSGMPLNFDEPEHVRMLRDATRRFVEAEMPRARAREWDRGNIYPAEVMRKLAAMGMMGLTVEEKYGGAGVDIYATMAVIEEIAKRSVAVACPYIMAVCYAGMNLGESASEAQKQELLPKVAAGNLLFAYGLSEPNVGGDLATVETTARREGEEIVINGAKRWCTGADIADYIFCLLRSGPKEDKYKNLSILLVPPTLPGITITPLGHLGIRGVETKDVTFDDVRVPAANILGGAEMWNKGWQQLAEARARSREARTLGLCAGACRSRCRRRMDLCGRAGAVRPRHCRSSGHPAHAGRSAHKVRAMRLMLYSAAWLADQGRPCSVETSMAKLFCCEGAAEVTQTCMRVTGAYGLSDEMDIGALCARRDQPADRRRFVEHAEEQHRQPAEARRLKETSMSDTQIRTGGMADPVTAADGFAEEIAARAAEIEASRFLPQDIARRFAEAGLYRLCVPAAYGGREAHPAVLFETVERLARADGSAAWWCVFIGATSGLVAGFLAPEEAQAVFGDPLTITAGVFAPRGKAVHAVENGVSGCRVNGRWQ